MKTPDQIIDSIKPISFQKEVDFIVGKIIESINKISETCINVDVWLLNHEHGILSSSKIRWSDKEHRLNISANVRRQFEDIGWNKYINIRIDEYNGQRCPGSEWLISVSTDFDYFKHQYNERTSEL